MKTVNYYCDNCRKASDTEHAPFGWYTVDFDTLSTRGHVHAHICSEQCLHEYFFPASATVKPAEQPPVSGQ